MSKINPEHLATRIAQFRDDCRTLHALIHQQFPKASKVRIKSTQEIGNVTDTEFRDPTLVIVSFGGNSVFSKTIDVMDLELLDDTF